VKAAVSSPRPVRIPRGSASPRPREGAGGSVERRPNSAGTQRAFRFAGLYLVALLVLDGILVGLDLSSAEASTPGVHQDIELFLGIAILIAVGSVVFALSPAPRYVNVRSDGVTVVGRWGGRVGFPPLGELQLTVLRHYPSGLLSAQPVDVVRMVDRTGRRRTYQLEAGLLGPATGAGPA
jgi:hypothetical protein